MHTGNNYGEEETSERWIFQKTAHVFEHFLRFDLNGDLHEGHNESSGQCRANINDETGQEIPPLAITLTEMIHQKSSKRSA